MFQLAEALQFALADHTHDCEVVGGTLDQLDRFAHSPHAVHALVRQARLTLAIRREIIGAEQRQMAHLVAKFHRNLVHPSLLGPENEKAAGDTATFDGPEFLEELSA